MSATTQFCVGFSLIVKSFKSIESHSCSDIVTINCRVRNKRYSLVCNIYSVAIDNCFQST
ncbi:MAG TPA: hypothetical protein DCL61_01195 [Cyanobacteria bacterium UBA12227]|nr:hypothetical protein [Cyanobacteria bacterium UBA12227]